MYFLIDEEGYYLEYVLTLGPKDEEGNLINPPRHVAVRPPNGLHRARWTGEKWVETKPQEEFDAEDFEESLTPEAEEVENAVFEIKTLQLLMEVGLL